MPLKISKNKSRKKNLKRNILKNRGAVVDKGAYSVIIILSLLIYGGYSMVGGTLPTRIAEVNPDSVKIVQPLREPTKKSLQLYTFSGATTTPHPTIIPLPTDSPDGPKLIDCEVNITGSQKPQMIWGFAMNSTPASGNQLALKVFYINKTALSMGAGDVTQMGEYYADHAVNPSFGNMSLRDSNNFPFFPSVYLTDITEKGDSVSGDAQKGGQPNPPQEIFGSWNAAGASNNRVQNGKYLGIGADAWPPANGPEGDHDSKFASEIIWRIQNLQAMNPESNQYEPLKPRHEYRAQVALHDSAPPNDLGLACIKFKMPN